MPTWTVDQAYDFGVLEAGLPAYSVSHSEAESDAYLAQLVRTGDDLHLYANSLENARDPATAALGRALFDAEVAGLRNGPRPQTPTQPPPQPPEKDNLCPIAQSTLQNATDRYTADKAKFDQASQGKDVADLQAAHDTVNRLGEELEHLNTEGDVQLLKDLAFLTGDTLKTLFGGFLPPVANALYSGFAIGRDSAILLTDVTPGGKLSINMNNVVDAAQLVASVVGSTLVKEEAAAAIDMTNVLIDAGQIPGHVNEITAKADVVAKDLIQAQGKLDDILFFQNNRATWEKSLSDEYNAVNQAVAGVYGTCVSQANAIGAQINTPTEPSARGPNTDGSEAVALASLGVVELKDPRAGTVIYGTANKDSITKATGDNGVFAGDGDDSIILAGSRNVVFGGRGNDTIILGPGTTNIVAFSGKFSDYKMAFMQGSLVTTDSIANRDGIDTIRGATHLLFLDGEYRIDFSVPDPVRALTKINAPAVVTTAMIPDPSQAPSMIAHST